MSCPSCVVVRYVEHLAAIIILQLGLEWGQNGSSIIAIVMPLIFLLSGTCYHLF